MKRPMCAALLLLLVSVLDIQLSGVSAAGPPPSKGPRPPPPARRLPPPPPHDARAGAFLPHSPFPHVQGAF